MAEQGVGDKVLLSVFETSDYEKFQLVRRDLLRRIDNMIPHCGDPARAEDMKTLLINMRTFTRCLDQYYEARVRDEGLKPQPKATAWLITLAAILSKHELHVSDELRVAQAIEKLIEIAVMRQKAVHELIETLTTVLPQGG
jgi:hypothetical protein